MAVTKGQNSYATIAEANAYLDSSVDASAWREASDQDKERALITATRLLDEMYWSGSAINDNQPLAFPRVCEYFDPKIGGLVYLDGSSIPQRIQNAAIELASHLVVNGDALVSSGSVESIKVGPISLTEIKLTEVVPLKVKKLFRPLLQNGTNMWWRAN